MTVKSNIVSGDGKGAAVRVSPEGAMSVVAHPHPPKDEDTVFALPVRQRFTDSASSSDMAVDGSSSPVIFSVDADPDFTIYLKTISVNIGDGGSPALNKFGALAALTNGVIWSWDSQDQGNIVLHEGIKTNLEFVRLGIDTAGIGTGTDAFLSDVSGGGSEKSYLPFINMGEMFGLPYGIRLRKGTTDRIIFKVNDDLTGLTTFDIITYGLKI